MWKLRPVVDILQQRFQSGWTLPAVFSFDEGISAGHYADSMLEHQLGLKSMLEHQNQQTETPPVSTTRLVQLPSFAT
ncbi:hypothetical protein F444_15063 [Phytophthora nicotianae P1976]|uniref:Uncharacterized protein n=1 Tax=Phytophthora nicotianae P1976 TaxID=1317066 RepID=A0A080ZN58_PHYNI|nr:hypothetical protein F444_15063 [Phytophthora nicotianae P1976]